MLQTLRSYGTRAAAVTATAYYYHYNASSSSPPTSHRTRSSYQITKCEGKKVEPSPIDNNGAKIEEPKAEVEFYHGSIFPKKVIREPKVPYPLWDENWDGLKPKNATREEKRELRRNGVTRHIILVRHGQYVEAKDADMRVLTPLGREQADKTGKRLADMLQGVDEKFGPCKIKVVRVSNMIRAKETADIIAKHLPGVERTEPDPDLNEGRPAINIPGSTSQRVIDALKLEGPRIERAYQRYFKRCVPDQKDEQRAVNESDTYNANTNNESSLQKDIARENPAEADSNSRKSDSLHEFEIIYHLKHGSGCVHSTVRYHTLQFGQREVLVVGCLGILGILVTLTRHSQCIMDSIGKRN